MSDRWSDSDQTTQAPPAEQTERAVHPEGSSGNRHRSISSLERRDLLTTGTTVAAGTLLAGCTDGQDGECDDEPPDADSGGAPDDRSLAFQTLNNEVTNRSLPVHSEIPSWLEGTLLRTGPAKFEVDDCALRHWFDGLAMLHRFAIEDGSVTYSNKYLETRVHEHATNEGELGYGQFATDPCRRIWERFFSLFFEGQNDNANVNIGTHADRFVSMTETPMPVEFDPETLETVGVVDYESDLGDLTTAHPHYDDGVQFNYVTDFSRSSEYKVYRVPEGESTREVVAMIPRDRPAYMHSFGLTDQYVILAEFPFVVDPLDFLVHDRPFVENYEWDPNRDTRFLVVDRETGEVADTYATEAFFAFHHVNAYEAGDEIVVDVVVYDDVSIIEDLYLDEIHSADYSPEGGSLERFRLGDAVARETLFEGPIELPRTNYDRVNTDSYRYVYGVGNREHPPQDVPNTLVKVDVETGATEVWDEPGTYTGEPVFVEAPDGTAEDDGVILSVVLDPEAGHSFLLVLDAATFEELARAQAPHHIPLGLHGNFYDI